MPSFSTYFSGDPYRIAKRKGWYQLLYLFVKGEWLRSRNLLIIVVFELQRRTRILQLDLEEVLQYGGHDGRHALYLLLR